MGLEYGMNRCHVSRLLVARMAGVVICGLDKHAHRNRDK